MLEALPWAAFLVSAVAVGLGIMRLRGQHVGRWMQVGLLASAGISLVSFLVLIALFVLVRVDFQYVFLYTSDAMPLRYRIAGAWAGREGSLLLWAVYTAIVAAAVNWWHRRTDQRTAGHAWTELILAGLSTAFLAAVVWQQTFTPTEPFFLQNRPGGNGLNPTLLSPFILIHPPVMFLAYALTAVPLAAVVSDLITGNQTWSRTAMVWSRVDWLLYTFAMGLGGIWAYYTLGFGGYWAWDPVEVANLLPWLALTVYLHAQLHHRRYGEYVSVGPLLGVLPFLFTLFSTISTRSGLWVSVHAFTDPTDTFDPDPASRLLSILEREPSLQFHVGMFLVVLLAFLALWARRLSIDSGRFGRLARVTAGVAGAGAGVALLAPGTLLGIVFEVADTILPGRVGSGLLILTALMFLAAAAPLLVGDESRKWRLDMRTLALGSVVILGMGLLVIFLWHIAAVNGWSTETYLGRFPVLATPVMLGLVLFQTHGTHGKRAWWITGVVALLAAAAALTGGRSAYIITLAIAVVLASSQRVLAAGMVRGLPPAVAWARRGLWLAALANVVFWLNPPTIRLGIEWTPLWPTQLVFGAAAFLGLHLATEVLCGRMRRAGPAHFIVGLLGAYYITPILALVSWRLNHGHREGTSSPKKRMHQVGLHGSHLAVAIVLLGYVTTTYLGAAQDLQLAMDEPQMIGASEARLIGVQATTDAGRIQQWQPILEIDGAARTAATLYYEPQTGSHFPLPATARLWDRDVYFAVDAVCIDPTGTCERSLDWVRAYETGPRMPAGIVVTQIEVQAFELPGMAMVWSALFLWLYFMGLMMFAGPERN